MNRDVIKVFRERWRRVPTTWKVYAVDLVDLLDALLADDPEPRGEPKLQGGWLVARIPDLPEQGLDPTLTCVLCGRPLGPGELVQYGGALSAGLGMSPFDIKCAGRCQTDWVARHRWFAGAANWSA